MLKNINSSGICILHKGTSKNLCFWAAKCDFEGFAGSSFPGGELDCSGKGVPSTAMCARVVVELRLSPGYAGVAVRSRKANRLMLYTRFIRPIFALALMRPIVRTIFPPMLVC